MRMEPRIHKRETIVSSVNCIGEKWTATLQPLTKKTRPLTYTIHKNKFKMDYLNEEP